MYQRIFPPEYYNCTKANSEKKKSRWFCNRPISPISKTDNMKFSNNVEKLNIDEHEVLPSLPNKTSDLDMNEKTDEFLEDSDDSLNDPDFNYSDYLGEINSDSDSNITENAFSTQEEIDLSPEIPIIDNIIDFRVQNFNENTNTNNLTETNKSDLLILGKIKPNGEKRKGNKGKDYCFYCLELVLNFARHLERNHSSELSVQKFISLPKNSLERKKILASIRKEGNFLNQDDVKKPVKRNVVYDTVPCDNCKGFYSTKSLWRHRKKCAGAIGRQHRARGENLLLKDSRIDKQLKENVFPRMKLDEITRAVKNDKLICAYGTKYLKAHRDKHSINVVSRKMRELAKILIEMKRVNPTIQNLFEALNPIHFDLLIAATKTVAKYDSVKETFEAPSFAINIRPTILQCCELAIIFVLKRRQVYGTLSSANAEADIKTLIRLIESQWHCELASQALNDLNVNKFNKITIVPLASDLKLFKNYLVSKSNIAMEQLKANINDASAYMTLLETIYCRIILLNRRRPGELQRLPLHLYEKLSNDNCSNYEEFSSMVTPAEKILMSKFKRIVIKGKRGRGVPILISPDVQEHIKLVLSYRNNFIDSKNVYLFGNINTLEPISGYKVLKKYATNSGAKNPSALTATKLRKHLATLCQVFSMSENDIEQLATFMGHTVGVHRGSYRMPDDIYQTATISKLLLLMERGEADQFKGKALNEIDVNLEENLMDATNSEANEYENGDEDEDNLNVNQHDCDDVDITQTNTIVARKEEINTSKKKECLKRTLVPWTEKQKTVVKSFFKKHIAKKIPPKKAECEELKELHAELLNNKDWLKIKVFVQNEYTKKLK